MQPFRTLTSTLIPIPNSNIDTDQIIPARYLKVVDKTGLAEGLFSGWRYLPDGGADLSFPLNQPEYQSCRVLLVGDNFGCGSSREHAAWALLGWGISAVISTSFADIFRNNALKNGLLPVVIDPESHRHLFELAARSPCVQVTIDLGAQTLSFPPGEQITFPIDAFSKACLLDGIDQLGYLLRHEPQIAAYEQARSAA